MKFKRLIQLAGLCMAATVGVTASATVTNIFLRTGTTDLTMPDGRIVTLWGFARDTAAGASDGLITVPGPAIHLPNGDWDLNIVLNNTLPEPVSIVIPNQTGELGDPERNTDGRIRSFTKEAAALNGAATYSFKNVKPGTFLYHSGSHPAVQIQMGLYGALTKVVSPKRAYPGAPRHEAEATILFSEIDPVVHDAVASGNYGPTGTLKSTIESYPQYFLINGKAYAAATATPISLTAFNSAAPGTLGLLRLINAGINYHTPVFGNYHLDFRAEDSHPYAFPRVQGTMMMAPLKTLDAYWTVDNKGTIPIFDRSLGLANGPAASGGMLAYIEVGDTSNSPPVVDPIADKVTAIDYTLAFQVVAFDEDLPAQSITYSLSGGAAGATLSPTGAFSWTVTDLGLVNTTQTFTVVVTDSPPIGASIGASTERQFSVVVHEKNLPPAIATIADKTIDELVPAQFDVVASDSNLPAQSLTYVMTSGPSGSSLSPSGHFTWTPAEDQGPGTYTVSVTVSDDGLPSLSASTSFTLIVNEVNLQPVLGALANRDATVGVPLTFTATATDPDLPAQALSFSLGAGAPSGAAITAGGAFSWTPTVSQVGTFPITVVVTDSGSPALSAQATFNVTSTIQTQTFSTAVGFILSPGVTGVPILGNAIPYPNPILASGTLGLVHTVTATINNLRHPRPSDLDVLLVGPGGTSVLLMSDCGGNTALVANNQATLTFSGAAVASLSSSVLLTGTYLPTDRTGSADTFLAPAPTSGWANTLSALVGTTANGLWTIYIRDNNPGPGLTPGSAGGASITLQSVPNTPPTLAALPALSGNELSLITANLTSFASDANAAQTLSFSLSGQPSGASITSAGVFSWTPAEAQGPGSYSITVNVTDGIATASQSLAVTVGEVNVGPTMPVITAKLANVGQQLSFSVNAADADLPAQTLTYSLGAVAPAGAAISATGVFTWTPSVAQLGASTITAIVTDPFGLNASRTFTVTVGFLAQTISNGSSISIPANGSANPYPRTITFSAALPNVQDLTVTLTNLRHPRPSDLDILLVGPSGQSVMLMSDCGGTTALNGGNQATLTFSDAAVSSLTSSVLTTGTYKPTDLAGLADTFVAPAPTSGWAATLSAFAGTAANGNWSIYIRDNAAGPGAAAGSVNAGVSLTIRSRP